jgi:hypothetical protein
MRYFTALSSHICLKSIIIDFFCRHSGEGQAKAGQEVKLFSAIQVDSRSWCSGCRIKSGMTENYGL